MGRRRLPNRLLAARELRELADDLERRARGLEAAGLEHDARPLFRDALEARRAARLCEDPRALADLQA